MYKALPLSMILSFSSVWAAFDIGFGDDSDLTVFVTRPDIKAPVFEVHLYDIEDVESGYWFIGPYASIAQQSHPRNYYQPCQTGPHIYDGNGSLIWSGACLVRNQNTCDFRVFQANDTYFMSALLHAYENDTKGHGIIMDNSYTVINNVYAPPEVPNFNMHEFNVLNGGSHALYITIKFEYVDVTALGLPVEAGWIANLGFREVDIVNGNSVFQWWAHDHVSLSESKAKVAGLQGPPPISWNWIHLNSIDKNADGDYLVSARFTDCIYKISGKDGAILWRLGGAMSSFALNGFNFSRQHDARWMEYSEDAEVISFLDNAADPVNETSSTSSALVVELDKRMTPMTARVLRRWYRPDQKLSRLRGNAQILPNGNAFLGWSDNSYISEHTPDGRLLLEARFRSERFVTYRAYKFNFIGAPIEPPVVRAFAYGRTPATSTTVCYVSWNGATEVVFWNFYRSGHSKTGPKLLGTQKRTGFETMFEVDGYITSVYVEGMGANGSALGTSLPYMVMRPAGWKEDIETPCDRERFQGCQTCTDTCLIDRDDILAYSRTVDKLEL